MQIRPATAQDRGGIIELLRESLGETAIPKSEALWAWKHEQNPFGPSFVLIAEENNILVGIRAFMQWKWKWKGKTYSAIRAVDTATHPDHQGKGIFKKLTLQQLELCKQQGVHFVFNTPNEQSRPGYLKMGWQQQGKMPMKVKAYHAAGIVLNKLFAGNKFPKSELEPSPFQEWSPSIAELVKDHSGQSELLTTILTPQYISWRYATNPLFRYNYFTDNENFLLISRIKNHGFTRELRLADLVIFNPAADARTVNKRMKKAVYAFCRENHIGIITFSGQQFNLYKPYLKWMGMIPVKLLGPIITVRDLNMNDQFNALLDYKNWSYSLGDMELF